MPYTKVFNKPYADGYKDRPDLSTPETAANLNAKDNAIEHIEDYLVNQKVSDLQNDSGFVTGNDVSEAIKGKADKSTTYTKTEVDELVPDNKDVLEDLSDSEGKLAYNGEVIGGGGNANERELTYAEYQALSEEEKMNGTNYFVTDYPSGSGGGGGSDVKFEEGAHQIGTWFDGRKVMRYCFNNIQKGNNEKLILENENIDAVLGSNLCVNRGNGEIDTFNYASYFFVLLAKKPFRSVEGIYLFGSLGGSVTGYVDYLESV